MSALSKLFKLKKKLENQTEHLTELVNRTNQERNAVINETVKVNNEILEMTVPKIPNGTVCKVSQHPHPRRPYYKQYSHFKNGNHYLFRGGDTEEVQIWKYCTSLKVSQ